MKAYGIEDAKSIIRHYGQNFFEFRTDGVFLLEEMLQYDPSQQLHWKYVCELDGPLAPNPLTAPCLPFPFTAHQLAAFMLDGVGAVIPSVYGDWEGGPDQEMLDDMGVLAREPRRAITEAYAAYVTAQTNAGKYPVELQMRAERLRKIFNYRNLKANTREGVFAHGIDRDEAHARRARAVASNTGFERQYDLATKDYQAASGAWRKAMVNELLQPAPEQTAPVVTDQTEAVVTGSNRPASVRRNRKKAWSVVAMPYMRQLYKDGKYKSATVFHKALMNRADRPDSPFTKVSGELYCSEAGTTVAEGTVGKVWAEIRER